LIKSYFSSFLLVSLNVQTAHYEQLKAVSEYKSVTLHPNGFSVNFKRPIQEYPTPSSKDNNLNFHLKYNSFQKKNWRLNIV